MQTLLLPGMDGTGRLFNRVLPLLDPALGARVVALPRARPLGYRELLAAMQVPAGPFALVGESFSGPLGVLLAEKYRSRVRGLVLVATFVRSPSPWLTRVGAALGAGVFRARAPDVALRWALLGPDAPDADVKGVRAVLESAEPAVLAHRVRAIAAVDVRAIFASSLVPTTYLGGARDRLVGPRVLAELRLLRPDMTSCILDAPHLVLQLASRDAAAAINAFLLPQL